MFFGDGGNGDIVVGHKRHSAFIAGKAAAGNGNAAAIGIGCTAVCRIYSRNSNIVAGLQAAADHGFIVRAGAFPIAAGTYLFIFQGFVFDGGKVNIAGGRLERKILPGRYLGTT
nr:hypothetical protein SPACI_52810 [Sporomusa acidovorans DSM 3132]